MFPSRNSGVLLKRLAALLLAVSMSTAWAAPLLPKLLSEETGMACCRRGKVHGCCKKKASQGGGITAQRPCGDRCTLPVLSLGNLAATLPVFAPVAAVIAQLHPVPPSRRAIGSSALLAHSLHQRPPPHSRQS